MRWWCPHAVAKTAARQGGRVYSSGPQVWEVAGGGFRACALAQRSLRPAWTLEYKPFKVKDYVLLY